MNGRRPQDPEAVIRRLSASLTDRAGDYRITPAFVERVRRLRKRRHITLRAVQTMAVVIVLVVAGAGAFDLLRPSPRVNFVSPPPATPSPTPEVPSASPSEVASQPAADAVPSTPPPPEDAEQPDTDADPPRTQVPEVDNGEPDELEPRATRVILDGEPRPGAICREDDSTLIATIELPEAETGYVIDLAEPLTMRIMGEGFTDVSDAVERSTDGDWAVYTATFTTDNDDFGVNEVRIEGPADPDAC